MSEKTDANTRYGRFIEPGTIQFVRRLPGPVDRVWKYLTDSVLRGKWLASGEMDLSVGGEVELVFNHDNLSPYPDPAPEKYKDVAGVSTMRGIVTEVDPPRLLSYTWNEDSGTDSEVTFELKPQDDDTVLLVLTHRRLGDNRELLIGVAAGWHTHLRILFDRLAGRVPDPFWSEHMKKEGEYSELLS